MSQEENRQITLDHFLSDPATICRRMIGDINHTPYYICQNGEEPDLILKRYFYLEENDLELEAKLTYAEEKLLEFASNIRMFRGMSGPEVIFLSRSVEFIRYKPSERIFEEGSSGEAFFYILNGSVDLFVNQPDAAPRRIATLGPHKTFGEIAPATHHPRNATAAAASDATILKIELNLDEKEFMPELYNRLYENIIALLSDKIEQNNSRF